jgi:hypothetical protein
VLILSYSIHYELVVTTGNYYPNARSFSFSNLFYFPVTACLLDILSLAAYVKLRYDRVAGILNYVRPLMTMLLNAGAVSH